MNSQNQVPFWTELKDVYQGAVLKIQYHLQSSATPVLPSIRHFLIDFEVPVLDQEWLHCCLMLGSIASNSSCFVQDYRGESQGQKCIDLVV